METVGQILARLKAELASAKTPEHRELALRHVRDFELAVQMRERRRKAQQRLAPKEPAKP
ncbi:MAG: hypothetical protein P4L80_02430 [Xanthobacteraceae bacterium]|nr:hypothetical protein [Xanthobacteraceae bacterium]